MFHLQSMWKNVKCDIDTFEMLHCVMLKKNLCSLLGRNTGTIMHTIDTKENDANPKVW